MTFSKRLLFVGSALLVGTMCGLALVACDNHKNPMMSQDKDMIGNYYGKMPLSDSKDYPLKTCSVYYGWNKHPENKVKCDIWTEQQHKEYIRDGMIPSEATLKEFRDPKFWQLVNPRAIEDQH